MCNCVVAVQPLPKGDQVLNFSDAEQMVDDVKLKYGCFLVCNIHHMFLLLNKKVFPIFSVMFIKIHSQFLSFHTGIVEMRCWNMVRNWIINKFRVEYN